MQGLSSQLNKKVTVYAKAWCKNELGEDDLEYTPLKTVWAGVTNWLGSNKPTNNGVTEYSTTHRFIIRVNAIPNISEDMFFTYQGVRYDIEYINPAFKYNDFLEIICKRTQGNKTYE